MQTNCATSDDPLGPAATSSHAQEYRIWNPDLSIGVLLDYEDYIEAIKHRWKTQKPCKKHRRMGYMCRNRAIPGTDIYYEVHGRRVRRREFETIYLHVWVLERSGKKRPPGCYLADHQNNDIYDCRRANLEWGNGTSNNLNRRDFKARRALEEQSGEAAGCGGPHRPERGPASLPEVSLGDAQAGGPLSIPF